MPILKQFEFQHIKKNGYTEQNVFEFTVDLRDWLRKNDYALVKKEHTATILHNKINKIFGLSM